MTEKQINEELEKGYTDMLEGRTKPAEQVFSEIYKDYNVYC